MNLFRRYLKRLQKTAVKRQMRVKIIGDKTGLAEDIQEEIKDLESLSKNFDKMVFQIALNYGGRDEITRAVNKLADDVRSGALTEERITEETIESYLDTAGVPDPDLCIRTSGELRTSNFLLWETAYSEYYFTDVLWPDFSEAELDKALAAYAQRHRRKGGV